MAYYDEMKFLRTPEDDDDIYGIDEWYDAVLNGDFTDYDGHGFWMKDGMIHTHNGKLQICGGVDNVCDPGAVKVAKMNGITGVCWFNR